LGKWLYFWPVIALQLGEGRRRGAPCSLEDADGAYRPPDPGEDGEVVTITIAHRGDPVGHRENTLEAFQGAVTMGAAMIELDCRLTRDRHVVVLHDITLTRLWAVPKPVIEVEWDVVRTIRGGGYRIPDLSEVLAAVEVPVMVDVPSVDVLEASLAVVERAKAIERCVFAGNTEALRRLRQLAPSARIALTWDHPHLPEHALLTETRPEWFNPYWRLVTPAVVEQMHKSGLGVSVWTVDGPSDIRRALDLGVDAVISNQVARLVAEVRRTTVPRHGDQER
jgi:glycerophosphoryl diester phosphodiesterase